MTPKPFLFFVPPGWLGSIGLSRFASCSTDGEGLLSDYARHLISLHDYRHNVERIFSPMTERFRNEWGDEVVPVQLRILIKELGDRVGHNTAYCLDSGCSWRIPYVN